jgi:hypothetical protein
MIIKIQTLIKEILTGDTGTPMELAAKLGVSERMLFKYIEIIKTEFNAPVKYNRITKTYYFESPGNLDLKWRKKNNE